MSIFNFNLLLGHLRLKLFSFNSLYGKYFTKRPEEKIIWQILKNPELDLGIMSAYVNNSKDGENKLNELRSSSLAKRISEIKSIPLPYEIHKYTYEHEVGETKAERFFIFQVNKRKDLIDLMHEYDQPCVIYKKGNKFLLINSDETTVKTYEIKINYKMLLKLKPKHLRLLFSSFIEAKFSSKKYVFKNIYVQERFSGFKRYLLQSKTYTIKWYKII